MTKIRRLVLDVLKPHKPGMVKLAEEVEKCSGVEGLNATIYEIDEEVRNLKVTIEGENIDDKEVREAVEDLGGSIHSIDEIVYGDKIVEESKTPQDK
ncbi:DUF211 domain-containing protein [Candidatus Nanohalovita haloferacivicina]|uniref:DUF211 domain-containing protein n=1 Tax=Candidatus Nanohalovita haloferacivicina TaxID=2978046 RepID=UPI00325F95B6|nr:Uncharacterized protein HBNXNv_0423 [Candidatus Nanohalobia archaeon BNXNv]